MTIDRLELSVFAETNISAIHLARSDLDGARKHIAVARARVNTPNAQAICDLREGQWLAHQGAADKARRGLIQAGIPMLERAAAAFSRLQYRREHAFALLHLADAFAGLNDRAASSAQLDQVADLTHVLGGPAFLTAELRGVRHGARLRRFASKYARVVWDEKKPVSPAPAGGFRVVSLGASVLLADGQPVQLGSHRALELLVFLLLNPDSSLEAIIAALCPDDDPKRAKNLFHQLKFLIAQHARGLQLAYDGGQRTYRVVAENALEFDLEEFNAALKSGDHNGLERALDLYGGAFLPHAGTEWAAEVRSEMEWLLVRSGVKVVQDLFEQGELEACQRLTRRLLSVEPLDVGLNRLLIEVTRQVEGELAATAELERAEARFRELGEVPQALERLRESLEKKSN